MRRVKSVCNERGFSLIEVAVSGLVGVVLVLGIGLLTENVVHQRASVDSVSASATLAERQMEQLLSKQYPATDADLTAGTHGPGSCASPPCKVDQTGAPSLNGPYLMQWVVVNNSSTGTSPLVDPTASSKKITVTVTHVSNPFALATLQTYYKYK
jgi:hypothetical protein